MVRGFHPLGCLVDAVPAITAAAGHRMFEIYEATAAHDLVIVSGEDPDIGLDRYLTGVGHSLISGHYSLAADNILEYEVVTPAGDIAILNQCTDTDLFFPFRGLKSPQESMLSSLLMAGPLHRGKGPLLA